ncbi:predicted protein [Lichtheimia corymbifera JMRC:FSU:9682]|uniref:Uncharacterized protein n=1 Tax=Lichtheimia corymbifera JMRC:FSU:9682 TaxID=1263082 RepID=A0A068S197_9FUNG|nr:predicted protein [Lichtheimia corymbifera JMRC:FSU:9682]
MVGPLSLSQYCNEPSPSEASAKVGFGQILSGLKGTICDTVTMAEYNSMTQENGKRCSRANIEGVYSPEGDVPLYLSINRLQSTVDGYRHQHSADNIEAVLLVCNHAMGPAAISDLEDWLDHRRQLSI